MHHRITYFLSVFVAITVVSFQSFAQNEGSYCRGPVGEAYKASKENIDRSVRAFKAVEVKHESNVATSALILSEGEEEFCRVPSFEPHKKSMDQYEPNCGDEYVVLADFYHRDDIHEFRFKVYEHDEMKLIATASSPVNNSQTWSERSRCKGYE